ncbi:hypothetical protein P7H00_11280 [Enterococcus pseudoavium]|uniref:Uncharacterized protein n=1 Tax=Enterococcus pseudoavium TaxID=44007 RepID=A0AAE4I3A5_9ENTE|nr:hypothetical protein [Enterococcus pseudoavium]MDT2737692.1 hypothetical protein [Enterococcus pseudoavium]
MADSQWLVTVLVAVVTSGGTLLATKSTNRASLTKTNNDNAIQLFEQYKELNEQLQSKVDRLEDKLEKLQDKYEKEIAFYQSEVERLEDENSELIKKLENVKGVD